MTSSSIVLVGVCLRLFCIHRFRNLVYMFLLYFSSLLSDAAVSIVPNVYHLISCCPDYLTKSPFSHISSTTIIIRSHQPASLPKTSLSHIYYITIILLHHLTTYTPPPQSSCISAAVFAIVLLNRHLVPPPPPSFLRISTTAIFSVIRLRRLLHYPITMISIL